MKAASALSVVVSSRSASSAWGNGAALRVESLFPNTGRINHPMAYADGDDHTNWVESYFSRPRRMPDGQRHHVSARYLAQYANEAAWKEAFSLQLPRDTIASPGKRAGGRVWALPEAR